MNAMKPAIFFKYLIVSIIMGVTVFYAVYYTKVNRYGNLTAFLINWMTVEEKPEVVSQLGIGSEFYFQRAL